MKKVFSILATILLSAGIIAQVPLKMSYQAVIRNNSNFLLSSTPVGMRINILQGSETGTVVYKEIYNPNPQTNASGLVSIEIGGGIPVSGTFAGINWADGPYFIKSEIDPTGGTNYTIVGTSQLLSVPYALQSKTAENITGGITEADPVFATSPANSITVSNIADWNSAYSWNNHALAGYLTSESLAPYLTKSEAQAGYLTAEIDGSITNELEMPVALSGDMAYFNGTNWVKLPAGTNNQVLTYCDGIPTWTNSGQCPLHIGDIYAGGIVFYVDVTGVHGLVCAPGDQSTSAPWGCMGTFITGADGTAVGTGNQNTIDINTECTTVGTAAQICSDLSLNGYDDWFLPSKDEIFLMYSNLKVAGLGGFTDTWYWMSYEGGQIDYAWHCYFNSGNMTNAIAGYPNKNTPGYVRAVRAF